MWKGEYNAAVTDAVYVEARVGALSRPPRRRHPRARRRASPTSARTPSRAGRCRGADDDQSSPGQRLRERHEERVGREPHLPDRRRVHARPGRRRRSSATATPATACRRSTTACPRRCRSCSGANVSQERPDDRSPPSSTTPGGSIAGVTLSLGLRLDRYQPGLPEQAGTGRTDVRGDRSGPHVQQLGAARRRERRSHRRRQDGAEAALRTVLALSRRRSSPRRSIPNPVPAGRGPTCWTNDANWQRPVGSGRRRAR